MPTGHPNTTEDFWKRVEKGPDCWEWKGTLDRGRMTYGRFALNGRKWWAHRLAYTLAVGPIPSDLVIDHLCRNGVCVRPSHLQAVDNRTNVITRGFGPFAEKARATECQRGHPFDLSNTMIRRDGTRECRACHNMRRHRKANMKKPLLDVDD